MRKNENVLLFVLKSRWKSKIFLLFIRLSQRFSLSLWKKKSKSFLSLLSLFFLSLLSLFFLSWKWKFLSKNKIFQRFDNFVKISLTCVKIRRSRLFNSSMNSAISFVEKYNFANTVTIIANRFSVSLSVSMFVFLRFFVKKKTTFCVWFREIFDFKITWCCFFFDFVDYLWCFVCFVDLFECRIFFSFFRLVFEQLSRFAFRLSISFFFESFSKKILRFISFFN